MPHHNRRPWESHAEEPKRKRSSRQSRGRVGPLRWFSGLLAMGLMLFLFIVSFRGCSPAPETTLITVGIEHSGDDGLLNPFASDDARALEQIDAFNLTRSKPENLQALADSVRKVDAKKTDTLLVYINDLAGVDSEGGYFLESRDKYDTRLRFNVLWEALREFPDAVPKLVILDLSRIQSDTWLGMLNNDVIAWLKDEIDRSEIDNLYVFTSAAAYEKSWVSQDLGRSVFGYYLTDAFSNPAADANGDRHLDLNELTRFVSENTNTWVIESRDRAGQHPQLFIRGGDLDPQEIKLARHPTNSVTSSAPGTSSIPPEKLDETLRAWVSTRNESAPEYRNPYWRRASEFRLFDVDRRVTGNSGLGGEPPGSQRPWHEMRTFDPSELADSSFLRKTLLNAKGGSDEGLTLPESQLEIISQQLAQQYEDDQLNPLVRDRIQALVEFREYAGTVVRGNWQAASRIEPLIVAGDRYRRQYEDLTFLQQYEEAERAGEQARKFYEAAEQLALAFREGESAVGRALETLPALSQWIATREHSHSASRQQRWEESVRRQIVEFYRGWFDAESSMFLKADGQSERELRSGLDRVLSDLRSVSANRINRLDRAELQILMMFHSTRELLPLLRSDHRVAESSESELLDDATAAAGRLDEQARRLTLSLNELAQELDEYARRLSEEAEDQSQTEQWREFADILRWPEMDVQLRTKLVQQFQKMTRNPEKPAASAGGKPAEKQSDPGIPREAWAGEALWHGLCAIHAITLTENPAGDKRRFDNLWESWTKAANFARNTNNDDSEVREQLRLLGDQIGNRLRLLGAPRTLADAPIEQLRKEALSAYCRHGYDAGFSLYEANPAQRWHTYRLADFALLQARRYREDYLAATATQIRTPRWNGRHWYQFAAETLAGAAQRLLEAEGLGGKLAEDLAGFQSLLASQSAPDFEVRPVSSEILDLGITRSGTVEFDFLSLPRDVTGVSSVWVYGNRSVLAFEKPPRPVKIGTNDGQSLKWNTQVLSVPDGSGDRKPIPLNSRIFFRGHLAKSAQPVWVNPFPPRTYTFALNTNRPETGNIVLNGTEYRDLMVIFDCSLSMSNTDVGNDRRVDTAWKVFRQFVSNMKVNNQRKVGLLRYGFEWLYTGRNELFRRPNNQPVTDVDPSICNTDMHFMNEKGKFQKGGNNRTMMGVREFKDLILNKSLFAPGQPGFPLEPWGSTPLYNAIDKGLEAFANEKIKGGVLFVLTDGGSSEGAAEKEKMLASIRRRLQGMPSVSVWIIAFSDDESLAALKQDFQSFIETDQILNRQVSYQEAKSGEKLEKIFEQLKEGTYTVTEKPQRVNPGFIRGPHELNDERGATVPRSTGQYVVEYIYGTQQMPVFIRGGERIVLELVEGHRIRHVPYPAELRSVTDGVTSNRTTAPFTLQSDDVPQYSDYLPNRLVAESYRIERERDQINAEFVISFDHGDETTPNWDPTKTVLEPAEVEFELRATDASNSPVKINWAQQYLTGGSGRAGRSVPTWKLTALDLPNDELNFQVQTFWKTTRTAPGHQPLEWNDLNDWKQIYITSYSRKNSRQLLFPLLIKGTRTSRAYQIEIKADIEAFQTDNPDEQIEDYIGEGGVLSELRVELGTGDVSRTFAAVQASTDSTYLNAGLDSRLQVVITIDEEDLDGQTPRVGITSRAARRQNANSLANWLAPRRSDQ